MPRQEKLEAPKAPRAAHAAAPWAFWLLGLAAAFHPAFRASFRSLQIYTGDPRLVQFLFEHSFRWVQGDPLHRALWSPPVFHPATGTGAFTDTIIGAAPFYWFWRAVGIEPDLSYQLWMMVCLSLNFAATYWFLSRALQISPGAAAFGAFLFGFASERLANFNSPQLFVLFYGVFALQLGLRALEPGRSRRSAALCIQGAAVLMALQFLSTWYPSFFWVLILAVTGGVAMAFGDTRRVLLASVRRNGLAILSATAIFALLVAPMAHAHLSAVTETGWRPWDLVKDLLPTWPSWAYAGHSNRVYGGFAGHEWFAFSGPEPTYANGVGFLTLGVAVVGLWRSRRSTTGRLVLLTTVLVILVSTPLVGDHSLWGIVYAWMPGAPSIRYVARIGMFLSMTAAIGGALFFERWRPRSALQLVLGALLAMLCMGEQLHRLRTEPTRAYRAAVLEIAASIDPRCAAFFLETEYDGHASIRIPELSKRSQAAAMWISLEAGIPTVNGVFGNTPRGWNLTHNLVYDAETRDAMDTGLRAWLTSRGVAEDDVCRLRIPAERMPSHRR